MSLPVFGADSRLDTDTVTSIPAESANFPAVNASDDRIFTVYKPGSAATEVILKTDTGGSGADVDYFMVVGHDFFDPAEDAGGALRLRFEHSDDDVVYTNLVDVNLVTNNKIIMRTFTSVNHRFYRLRLTRGSSFISSLGQAQWGVRVELPFGFRVGFDPQAERIISSSSRAQNGNILGAIRRYSQRNATISSRLVQDSFVRDETANGFQKFWDDHASLLKPFVFAWNPGNAGSFEQDAFFGVVDTSQAIQRPLRTQVDTGFRDVRFGITGLKE